MQISYGQVATCPYDICPYINAGNGFPVDPSRDIRGLILILETHVWRETIR